MEYLKFYGQKPIDVVFVSSQIRQGFFRLNMRFFYAFNYSTIYSRREVIRIRFIYL